MNILRKLFLLIRPKLTKEQIQKRQRMKEFAKSWSDPNKPPDVELDCGYRCPLPQKDKELIAQWIVEQYEKQQQIESTPSE